MSQKIERIEESKFCEKKEGKLKLILSWGNIKSGALTLIQ
jgi:hypothetical protein